MLLRIRTAQPGDIDAMFAISSRVHLTQYQPFIPSVRWTDFVARFAAGYGRWRKYYQRMLERIKDPDWKIYVVTEGDRIVGQSFVHRDGPNSYYISSLAVDPATQGSGVGSMLLEQELYDLPHDAEKKLTVLESNTRAIKLYEEYGFVVTNEPTPSFFGARQVTMRHLIDNNKHKW